MVDASRDEAWRLSELEPFIQPSLSNGRKQRLGFFISVSTLGIASLPAIEWVRVQWTQGLFGGYGAAFLTPLFAIGLAFIARRIHTNPPEVSADDNRWLVLQTSFALITAIVVTFGRIEDHYWFGILALILPLWVYVALIDFGGVEWARAYRFPVFFLYFSLPVEPLIYVWADTFLQELTADLAYVFLNSTGFPVKYWNAHTLYSNAFYVIVDETCAGMNMIVSLFMYAVVFAWLFRLKVRTWIFPLGCVLPLALFSNGVRVAFIYVLGVKGGTELAMGHWHELSGFFAFLPTLLGVYLVTSLTHLRCDASKEQHA